MDKNKGSQSRHSNYSNSKKLFLLVTPNNLSTRVVQNPFWCFYFNWVFENVRAANSIFFKVLYKVPFLYPYQCL